MSSEYLNVLLVMHYCFEATSFVVLLCFVCMMLHICSSAHLTTSDFAALLNVTL